MEHSFYISGIKQALKLRSITYEELAQHLKMSESGVKKMLNAKDISFRRVLRICELLGVTPGQLFTMAEKSAIPEVVLSSEQQEALIKNRVLLAVYWRFVIEKREAYEIEKLERLSASELRKYFNKLVELRLLRQVRGQYRSFVSGKFRWSDDSKLAKFLNKEWSELTLKRSLSSMSKGPLYHRLSALRLSYDSYSDTLRKLAQVLNEAAQISEREEVSLRPEALQNATFLVAAVPMGVLDSEIQS